MQVHVAGIYAKCFSCGCKEFVFLHPRPGQPADKLTCGGCSAEVAFDDLRSQIGRAAIAPKPPAALQPLDP